MRFKSGHITALCILSVLLTLKSTAQDAPNGRVSISEHGRITRLVEKHKEISKSHPEFDGFRVQIFFDSGNNSKSRAYEVYKSFLASYPEHEAYVVFQEPNYKVRVGDFRTRLEAEGFLQQIVAIYPSSFVIKDQIKFPPLNQNSDQSEPQ